MKFLIVVVALVAVANGKSICSTSWANLMGEDQLFGSAALTGPGDCSTMLSQLKNLLNDPNSLSQLYEQYKAHYNKEAERSQAHLFGSNLLKIAEHNIKFETGKTSWSKGVNKFTDMTDSELTAYTGDLMANANVSFSLPTLTSGQSVEAAPDALDWRSKGILTPVKNQKSCGSCWAFGTIAIVEAASAKKAGAAPVALSEQELVDCDTSNSACNGGSFQGALDYIKKNGVSSAADYPYTAKKERCVASTKTKRARVASFGGVQRYDENAMKEAVANYGPIGTSAVVGNEWYSYKGGVYDGACGNGGHAMATVGYGNESGKDYWIVRNSWGDGWGEKGYMKLIRGKNKCTIASRNVVYTTIA